MNRCKACNAAIFWMCAYPTPNNPIPKANPINDEPSDNGNLLVNFEERKYRVLTGEELKEKSLEQELYLSHFANCGARNSFRRKS